MISLGLTCDQVKINFPFGCISLTEMGYQLDPNIPVRLGEVVDHIVKNISPFKSIASNWEFTMNLAFSLQSVFARNLSIKVVIVVSQILFSTIGTKMVNYVFKMYQELLSTH
jgi:hypothetical protein